MHAGHLVAIVLGLLTVAGVVLYWWADRTHFPRRSYNSTRRTLPSIAGAVIGVVVGIAFVSWLVAVAVLGLETRICTDQAAKLDTSSEYSWTAGCFIEIDGDLIPYDLYRLQENL